MEKNKVDRTVLEYKKDKRIALFYTLISATILILLLRFSGYQIPTPPLPQQILFKDAELEFLDLEIQADESQFEGGSQGSAGTPSNDPLTNKPNPQNQQVVTDNNSQTTINSGNAKRTNTDEVSQNQSTTIMKSENPFGTGGGADHGTSSGIFGDDKGPGNGKGNGNGLDDGDGKGTGQRVRTTNIDVSNIKSNIDCTIKMRLSVNAEGNVVGVEVLPGTSTTDKNLISTVTAAVKQQIKYTKRNGAAVEKMYYTVNIKAQ